MYFIATLLLELLAICGLNKSSNNFSRKQKSLKFLSMNYTSVLWLVFQYMHGILGTW